MQDWFLKKCTTLLPFSVIEYVNPCEQFPSSTIFSLTKKLKRSMAITKLNSMCCIICSRFIGQLQLKTLRISKFFSSLDFEQHFLWLLPIIKEVVFPNVVQVICNIFDSKMKSSLPYIYPLMQKWHFRDKC